MKKGQIVLLIIVILVIIIVVINRKKWFGSGKKPGGTTSPGSNISAQATADRLYELMEGFTIYPSSRKEVTETLTQISKSSNADFTAVWNAFGNRDGNLAEWAADEYYVDSAISNLIKDRVSQLGLK